MTKPELIEQLNIIHSDFSNLMDESPLITVVKDMKKALDKLGDLTDKITDDGIEPD